MVDREALTVAIVDDHALIRDGIRKILEAEPGLAVVGEAGDSNAAATVVAKWQPRVVLLDVEMPGDDVATVVRRLRAVSLDSAVVVLSIFEGPHLVRRLLEAGVRGYLLKSATRQELLSAIRSVADSPDRIVLSVSRESLNYVRAAEALTLSRREREILQLTAEALSNTQIASRLSLTEATVKRHLRNIFAKLGAVSRIDAVNKALIASLITFNPTGQTAAVPAGRPVSRGRPDAPCG